MTTENSPESEASNSADDLKYTELTLRLPGELPRGPELRFVAGYKRGSSSSSSHSLDLNLGQGTAKTDTAKWLVAAAAAEDEEEDEEEIEEEDEEASSAPKPPPAKAQIVGWPPVRASRKNIATPVVVAKFVKVAVDGAPFLRKVDLQVYTTYEQLLKALGDMFSCFTIRKYINDGKLMEPVNGSEYVAAYEDKDGDWMMVGDVPWKMFVESCKRLRLMKSSDAIGLAPTTPSR